MRASPRRPSGNRHSTERNKTYEAAMAQPAPQGRCSCTVGRIQQLRARSVQRSSVVLMAWGRSVAQAGVARTSSSALRNDIYLPPSECHCTTSTSGLWPNLCSNADHDCRTHLGFCSWRMVSRRHGAIKRTRYDVHPGTPLVAGPPASAYQASARLQALRSSLNQCKHSRYHTHLWL